MLQLEAAFRICYADITEIYVTDVQLNSNFFRVANVL